MSERLPSPPAAAPTSAEIYPFGLHLSRASLSRFGLSGRLEEPVRDLLWNLRLLTRHLERSPGTRVPAPTDLYLLATLGDIQRHLLGTHLSSLKLDVKEFLPLMRTFWFLAVLPLRAY